MMMIAIWKNSFFLHHLDKCIYTFFNMLQAINDYVYHTAQHNNVLCLLNCISYILFHKRHTYAITITVELFVKCYILDGCITKRIHCVLHSIILKNAWVRVWVCCVYVNAIRNKCLLGSVQQRSNRTK